MNTHQFIRRILIFVTLTVFTITAQCSVFAYDGAALTAEAKTVEASNATALQAVNADSNAADSELQSLMPDVPPLAAPTVTAFLASGAIKIYWTEVDGADGYFLFRKKNDTENWTKLKEVKASTLRYADKSVKNGTKYTYAICAYQNVEVTVPAEPQETTTSAESDMTAGSEAAATSPPETTMDEPAETITTTVKVEGNRAVTEAFFWLSSPAITSFEKSGKTLTAAWKANSHAAGYQLEYAKNRFFDKAKTVKLTGQAATSYTKGKLSASSAYYVRVRAYATVDGVLVYSPWSLSSNAKTTKTSSITRLKRGSKAFELRGQAKQKVGQYDTLQGGCYDEKYGYFVLYNRNNQKCKIAKVNMKTRKVTKVSKAMKIYHGNDLAYNPDTNQLIVVYEKPNYKQIAYISPTTLKVTAKKTLSLPNQLPGMTEKDRTGYKGITAIAYNTTHKQYVARIQGQGHLLIFDQDFNPIRYIRLTKKDGQTYQGIDTIGDYILVGQSYSSGKPYNIISVYDWTGTYLSKVNVKKGYELENVFHGNGYFYAGFYTSYYQTVYVKKTKIKRVKGKKKKVKVKVKTKQLVRNNYIYRIKTL